MSSLQLKLTSFDAVPSHMRALSAIAASQGLSTSAMLRLMVAQKVRRKSGKKTATRETRTAEQRNARRGLKRACEHFFGPEGDLTPEQIARLRGE
jgi:hypothetical protein